MQQCVKYCVTLDVITALNCIIKYIELILWISFLFFTVKLQVM